MKKSTSPSAAVTSSTANNFLKAILEDQEEERPHARLLHTRFKCREVTGTRIFFWAATEALIDTLQIHDSPIPGYPTVLMSFAGARFSR